MDDAASAMVAYFVVTTVLYAAAFVGFLGGNGGSGGVWLGASAVVGLVGIGIVHFTPKPLPRRVLGLVTVLAIVGIMLVFATDDLFVTNLLAAQAAIFLAMHIGASWSERMSWIWEAILIAGIIGAAFLSPAQAHWVVYVMIAMGVVIACEAFSAFARRMRYSALHDPLTGLLNRLGIEQTVESMLPVYSARALPVTMAVIDLDNFKQVNDRFGHIAGDVLLSRVAEAWRSQLRNGEVLGRLGGDEFVLFMPGVREHDAEVVLERLRQSHAAGWSAGTVCLTAVQRWAELYRAADAELYRAKRRRPKKADPQARPRPADDQLPPPRPVDDQLPQPRPAVDRVPVERAPGRETSMQASGGWHPVADVPAAVESSVDGPLAQPSIPAGSGPRPTTQAPRAIPPGNGPAALESGRSPRAVGRSAVVYFNDAPPQPHRHPND
ncbi:GGDEF domain-containing protein [Millisia brevis]|uniref:GGDEF domain-containing protein n=1 Tax=Millisia brevis TaxID=264148 RepID=UPI0009FFEE0F|nr:GGDEF domain-containing protein [Millisia brevis]